MIDSKDILSFFVDYEKMFWICQKFKSIFFRVSVNDNSFVGVVTTNNGKFEPLPERKDFESFFLSGTSFIVTQIFDANSEDQNNVAPIHNLIMTLKHINNFNKTDPDILKEPLPQMLDSLKEDCYNFYLQHHTEVINIDFVETLLDKAIQRCQWFNSKNKASVNQREFDFTLHYSIVDANDSIRNLLLENSYNRNHSLLKEY